MISTLSIENFKCFDNLRLNFGKLTLFTGFNSAGKSTAIQPLLLLSQHAKFETGGSSIGLNGALVKLGTVGDVLPAGASDSFVRFEVSTAEESAVWTLTGRSGERHLELPRPEASDDTGAGNGATMQPAFAEALRRLSYLSAVREGPSDSYPLPNLAGEDAAADVGVDGRYAAYWYDVVVDEEVPSARRHPSEPATSMRKQFDAWFSTLFPDAQVTVQHLAQVAAENLQFRSDIGDWRRPVNVGYGFTYAFPVLVALLAARREGQIVIIDSPEAHLHPRAQSQMGRMLATFAAAGVQTIVETHSDHLLNGVRLAVKDGVLAPSDAVVHFFAGKKASSPVVSPLMNREGLLSDWPEGFFDQSERDLAMISGWI